MKIPKIRFKNFNGDWEEKKIGEISTSYSGGTPKSNESSYYDGDIPFIRSGEIHSDKTKLFINELAIANSSAKMVNKGDILFAMYGATSGEVSLSKINGAINQAILCINTNSDFDNYFLTQLLKVNKDRILLKYLQGGQGNLSASIVKEIKLYFPNKEEQKKISSFFRKFDEKIEKQEFHISELKDMKKGYLQKIFSNNVRFKDLDGSPFPDWNTYKIGDIGKFYNGLSGKKKSDFENGNKSYITYMSIFQDIIINEDNLEKVYIKNNEKQNKVEFGDILFTQSSETIEEIGMNSVWLNNKEVYLNSFSFGCRLNLDEFNPLFVNYLLKSENVRRKIVREGQGSTRMNLASSRLRDVELDIPCLDEQNKIAEFLSKIDKKIETEIKILNNIKLLKKAYMNQMFV